MWYEVFNGALEDQPSRASLHHHGYLLHVERDERSPEILKFYEQLGLDAREGSSRQLSTVADLQRVLDGGPQATRAKAVPHLDEAAVKMVLALSCYSAQLKVVILVLAQNQLAVVPKTRLQREILS